MSLTFTKLFSSITESTVWCEPNHVRIMWITMLAMADRRGRVWGSVPGLANRARVSVEEARDAITRFLSPDPDSRTPDHEGRRVEPIDGGWRLLNHEKYRAIRDEESIKESKRNYINAKRAEERKAKGVENVERGRDNAEADTESEADTEAEAYSEPESKAVQTQQQLQPRSAVRVKKPRDTTASKTAATWHAYSQAYFNRYGVEPVRNAKVNGMLAKFVDRVGATEAPDIVGHYVRHQKSIYVSSKHCVDLLLRDAEGLRTEWATGTAGTFAEARMSDETAARGNVFTKLIKEIQDER